MCCPVLWTFFTFPRLGVSSVIDLGTVSRMGPIRRKGNLSRLGWSHPFQQAASKQQAATKQPCAKWAKGQNSIAVVAIWLKFRWMVPMGMRYNHTKLEQETQRW